jgi:hypothetical protein
MQAKYGLLACKKYCYMPDVATDVLCKFRVTTVIELSHKEVHNQLPSGTSEFLRSAVGSCVGEGKLWQRLVRQCAVFLPCVVLGRRGPFSKSSPNMQHPKIVQLDTLLYRVFKKE